MKWIDIPPVWLAIFAAMAWIQGDRVPVWPVSHPLVDLLGGLLVGGGLLLMILAVMQMQRHKTTPIPHMEASALVTDGIFARSRNPIYLGDAIVLAGLCLRWEALAGLVLVPLFMWVITDRFIHAEEDRLQASFPQAFEEWSARVRRWV